MSRYSERPDVSFWPARCSNDACDQSRGDGKGFFRHGHYISRARGSRIPRFLCRECRHTVSSQTFDRTYRLRRPDLDDEIRDAMARGTSLRGIARELGINRKTVSRRLRRAREMRGAADRETAVN